MGFIQAYLGIYGGGVTGVVVTGPFYAAAVEAWSAGAVREETWSAGAAAQQTYAAGGAAAQTWE